MQAVAELGRPCPFGGTASFQAGVGEWARADARIILEGLRNITTRTRTKEGSYVVWQNMANAGIKSETLVLPSISGPTKPIFSAPGGLTVQLPQSSDFKSQISTLAQQPGMGYLNTLLQRRDVNWQPVKLAYDQWDFKQSGLTPGGAALVAVVVAYCTAGVGSALVGAEAGTAGAAMANAAVSSLAAQATISLINNKGDIGKTLKELGSSQTVKATLAAVLTAGVLDKIGATDAMKSLTGPNATFADKLSYNLINATGRALTNTAITGGNLEDALKQALVGGIVDTLHGQVASQIKALEADYLAHKLAHALAGCVAGAAAGGACKDVAIGSAIGEIVAQMFDKPAASATKAEVDAFNNKVLAYAKLVSGAVAAYAGGNAQTAITTAETAVRTNYLTDAQKQKKEKELASCTTLVCAAGVVAKYSGVSGGQDAALLIGVAGGIGYQTLEQAVAIVDMLKNPSATFAALTALVNDPEFRAKVGNQVADDYKARIALQVKAYNEGGWNGATASGVEAGRLAVDIVSVATATVGAGKVAATTAKATSAIVADAFALTSETVARGLLKFDYLVANGGLFGADGKPFIDLSKLSTTQKGMIGELLGGQAFMGLVPDGSKLGRAAAVGQTGIDDVFKVNRPGVDYVVIEYKFGTSTLKNTADGLQMSDTWVSGGTTGYNRILEAVGKNQATADAINAALKAGRVEKWLVQTDPYGNVTFGLLDKNGKLVPNPQMTSQILGRAK